MHKSNCKTLISLIHYIFCIVLIIANQENEFLGGLAYFTKCNDLQLQALRVSLCVDKEDLILPMAD